MIDELNENYLKEHLPDEPISNFKELQYFYGVLVMASRGYDSNYGIHLTNFEPNVSNNDDDTESTEDTVIFLDFVRDDNSLVFTDVSTTKYYLNDKDQHEKLLFSRYVASSRGKEHSITQKSKATPDVENVVSKVDWVLDWIEEDAVQDSFNQNNWLFKELETLNQNEELRKQIKKRVKSRISEPDECLVTIRIKEEGEWKYPGDYKQLIAAMKERKLRKSLDKTAFNVLSKGPGKTFITGEHSEELVGAPADSLNTFKTKQQSVFKNLRSDETSWLATPVSFNESLHISLSNEIIDDLYQNVFNHRVYFLPYFTGEPTVEKSKKLYKFLTNMRETILDGFLQLESLRPDGLDSFQPNELRYFTIGLESSQNTMYNLLYTIPRLERPSVVGLSQKYSKNIKSISNNTIFTRDDLTYAGDKDTSKIVNDEELYKLYMFDFIINNSDKVAWNKQKYQQVLYGTWIKQALYDGYKGDFTEDDPRTVLYQSTLEKTLYSWDTVINECVKELVERTSERISENKNIVPPRLIAHQYALIQTLIEEGIIEVPTTDYTGKRIKNPISQIRDMSEPAEELSDAMESLPESTSDRHKYAFAVGGLIGRLAAYQRSKRDMNRTVINDHPVDRITEQRLREVVALFVDKASVYNLYGYSDQVNLIRTVQPGESDQYTTANDIKYFYALGVAFGNSQYYRTSDEDSETT